MGELLWQAAPHHLGDPFSGCAHAGRLRKRPGNLSQCRPWNRRHDPAFR